VYFQDVSLASVRIGLAGPASLPTNQIEYGTLQEEGESFKRKIAEKNRWHYEPAGLNGAKLTRQCNIWVSQAL